MAACPFVPKHKQVMYCCQPVIQACSRCRVSAGSLVHGRSDAATSLPISREPGPPAVIQFRQGLVQQNLDSWVGLQSAFAQLKLQQLWTRLMLPADILDRQQDRAAACPGCCLNESVISDAQCDVVLMIPPVQSKGMLPNSDDIDRDWKTHLTLSTENLSRGRAWSW